jgi:malonyl CoA-acyl carrier protein transacylase
MPSTAILFPGQGSHTENMREETVHVRPDLLESVRPDLLESVRPDLLEKVTAAVGEDPFPRVEDGTNFAQPAMLCAGLPGWEAMGRPDADFMAGHSLGETGPGRGLTGLAKRTLQDVELVHA